MKINLTTEQLWNVFWKRLLFAVISGAMLANISYNIVELRQTFPIPEIAMLAGYLFLYLIFPALLTYKTLLEHSNEENTILDAVILGLVSIITYLPATFFFAFIFTLIYESFITLNITHLSSGLAFSFYHATKLILGDQRLINLVFAHLVITVLTSILFNYREKDSIKTPEN